MHAPRGIPKAPGLGPVATRRRQAPGFEARRYRPPSLVRSPIARGKSPREPLGGLRRRCPDANVKRSRIGRRLMKKVIRGEGSEKGQSWSIMVNRWQSVAIGGNRWQSVAIGGNRWQSVAISGQWKSGGLRGERSHMGTHPERAARTRQRAVGTRRRR